jgi:hypothetical protein
MVTHGSARPTSELHGYWSARFYRQPSKLVVSSSWLYDDLGRFRRVKAERGRYASLDTTATARGMAATRRRVREGQRGSAHVRPRSLVPLACHYPR